MRVDAGGEFWDIIGDVISLGASIVEVAANPTDPWAWASLAGDVIDLAAPGISGLGEVTKAVKVTTEVVDKTEDVVSTAKKIYKTADKTSDIRKATGSYEIIYESGKNYVGKGGFKRALTSAEKHARKNDDVVKKIRWKSAPSDRDAFIDEFFMQKKHGVNNSDTYNKIWSPGRRYYRP